MAKTKGVHGGGLGRPGSPTLFLIRALSICPPAHQAPLWGSVASETRSRQAPGPQGALGRREISSQGELVEETRAPRS